MISCYLHRFREMNNSCSYCQTPLCEECASKYHELTICPDCVRRFTNQIKLRAIEVRANLYRELIAIGVLFAIGLAILICILLTNQSLIVIGLYAPFILPCTVIIYRMIKSIRNQSDNLSARPAVVTISTIILTVLIIVLSPVVVIARTIKASLDLRTVKETISRTDDVSKKTRDYSEQALMEEKDDMPDNPETEEEEEAPRTDITGITDCLESDADEIIRDIGRRVF